ncbi:helix-turn-helix domain-containing protein [Actinokineospora sp.]|uniref:helix-turn-helix domain-containing protein n=1 Tax=Actinokineospora sp. TaxID=1872133 RepID=UPI00403782E3
MSIEPDRQDAERSELAQTLRELRKAAGLSGERLAVRCAMSQAKISRIETGRTLPTVIDVERILTALEVPPDIATSLVSLARRANVDYTSSRAYARIGLWRRQEELNALGKSASVVRYFLPAIPTGLLQARAYARRVLTPIVAGRPSYDVERILETRLAGQAILDDRSRRFSFLLTEQAVRWKRAPAPVMVEQLQHMAEISARPNVELAVLPQSVEVSASPLNIFVIYDERLVTVETFSGGISLRDPLEIAYHRNLFDYFLGRALTDSAARAFLHGVAAEFMRNGD